MINEIQKRYTEESNNISNLGCGNNLDFLKLVPGESILDLGCGKGNEAIQAAIQTGAEGKVVGLDITPEMIDIARINAADMGVSNVVFTVGNIEALPFEDNTFDAVMSNCVINHAKNKTKVYSEISRVLKADGRFVISDAVTKTSLPTEVKSDPAAWAQCFGGAVTESEYLDSITSSGFKNINILKRREYIKNGYDFISLTIMAIK